MKKLLILGTMIAVFITMLAIPIQVGADGSVIYVYNLEPSWTAFGGGGVFSAYIGPPAYGYVSPGTTTLYDGREAGIIKAGLNVDPDDGHYWDEGLLAFMMNVDVSSFALQALSYDVENETGTNPVWVRIRLVGGTQYQFVPAPYGTGWHTVDASAGKWQLMDDDGNGVGPLMTLSEVAVANPGTKVDRVYLTLGMGDSYHGSGSGTVAWVDKVTIGDLIYDFVVNHVTDISGTVDNTVSITVAAPGSFTFGTFGPGDQTACSEADGSVTVTAGSNGVADWRVDVASATSPAFGGYMWRWDGSSYVNPLATKLIIGPNGGDLSYWADTGYSISGTLADSPKAIGLCGKQTITAADKTSGTYWITIVFTGSVTP